MSTNAVNLPPEEEPTLPMEEKERRFLLDQNGGEVEGEIVEEPLTDELEETEGRETWSGKVDFLLSVIGFAVDLANIWRFPYLCYKNGGGAFLVPYTIMLVLGGIPLFYMELALGQFYQKGAISTWGKICPFLKGIGWTVILIAFFTDFFYNVIISWGLFYLAASFSSPVPWASCGPWASENCFSSYDKGNLYPECEWKSRRSTCKEYTKFHDYLLCSANKTDCTFANFTYPMVNQSGIQLSSPEIADQMFNVTSAVYNNITGMAQLTEETIQEYCDWKPNTTSPATEYFEHRVLGINEANGLEYIGGIQWENTLCLLAVYLICYFSLFRGIGTSGKVVWFTALFPYVVLIILLILGLTLDGAMLGIRMYLNPDFTILTKASVWIDAATQVYFSLGPGFGVLLAYSSYNDFNNNVYKDAIMTSIINCMTSFLAGIVVFIYLGDLSDRTCKDFYDVAKQGPGLVFEVYPEALALLPFPPLWSILFFLMLLTLGLDSSFGGSEAIITALTDEFPVLKNKRKIFVGVLFGLYFLVGLASCTKGGMYVMKLFEDFSAGYAILFAVFCEAIAVSWIYGVWRFSCDVKAMIGSSPGPYWVACWALIAPVFIMVLIISGLKNVERYSYEGYDYPAWGEAIGWMITAASTCCIPLGALVMAIVYKGDWKRLFNGWWSDDNSYATVTINDYRRYCGLKPKLRIPVITFFRKNGDIQLQEHGEPESNGQTTQIA